MTSNNKTMSQNELDLDEAKREVREKYETETGESLPEHVLENLHLLSASGPTFDDLHDHAMKARQSQSGEISSYQLGAVVLVTALVVGGVSYGAGVALAGGFGVAVVALVSVAFGFVIGVLAS